MTESGPIELRRYRRRILGWGLLVLVVAFAAPAVFALRAVGDDLERRVPEALVEVGVDGVTAEFSGQDGTLHCEQPIDDTDTVLDAASGVRGVRTIELDDSCLAGVTSTSGVSAATSGSAPSTDAVDGAEPSTTEDVPVPTVAEVETIADVVATDPQFSQLATLLQRTGLTDTLGVGGPFTLLAPTDDAFDLAFDALGADAFQEFVSDDERLRLVLLHHVTSGEIPSASFVDGMLTMLDGSAVQVDVESGDVSFASGGITAHAADETGIDIEAANGVVHAIDQVLPAAIIDPSVSPERAAAGVSVELGAGRIVLSGVIASQAQRGRLLTAAEGVVADDDLVDELIVDASSTLTDEDIAGVAMMIPTFPDRLVVGVITAERSDDDDGVRLVGVVADDVARASVEELGTEAGVEVRLTVQMTSDTNAAEVLQTALDGIVGSTPFVFEPDSTELVDGSEEIVDAVAALLVPVDDLGTDQVRTGGITVTIVGHTDSDGDADRNQLISEGRALRVLEALVEAGVSEALLAAEGRGENELVVDADGREDKRASRRIVFVVEVAADDETVL